MTASSYVKLDIGAAIPPVVEVADFGEFACSFVREHMGLKICGVPGELLYVQILGDNAGKPPRDVLTSSVADEVDALSVVEDYPLGLAVQNRLLSLLKTHAILHEAASAALRDRSGFLGMISSLLRAYCKPAAMRTLVFKKLGGLRPPTPGPKFEAPLMRYSRGVKRWLSTFTEVAGPQWQLGALQEVQKNWPAQFKSHLGTVVFKDRKASGIEADPDAFSEYLLEMGWEQLSGELQTCYNMLLFAGDASGAGDGAGQGIGAGNGAGQGSSAPKVPKGVDRIHWMKSEYDSFASWANKGPIGAQVKVVWDPKEVPDEKESFESFRPRLEAEASKVYLSKTGRLILVGKYPTPEAAEAARKRLSSDKRVQVAIWKRDYGKFQAKGQGKGKRAGA